MQDLYRDMSKLAFLTIATLIAAILSPSVIANTFAKSSDGDSGGSGSSSGGGDNKPKTAGHKKDDSGGGMIVPGSPVVSADEKDKDSNNGGHLIVPGSPVVAADNGNDGGNSGYNNDNNDIKTFNPSKSSFSIGGSDGKVARYIPGFNETFYNSTLPYCFSVQSGSCYNSATGQITP